MAHRYRMARRAWADRRTERTQAAKDAILAGDADEARSSAQQASSSASAAVEASESTIWRAFAAIPGLGRPFETVRQIAQVVDGLTSEVVVPAMDAEWDPVGRSNSVARRKDQPCRVAAGDSHARTCLCGNTTDCGRGPEHTQRRFCRANR